MCIWQWQWICVNPIKCQPRHWGNSIFGTGKSAATNGTNPALIYENKPIAILIPKLIPHIEPTANLDKLGSKCFHSKPELYNSLNDVNISDGFGNVKLEIKPVCVPISAMAIKIINTNKPTQR